MKYFSLLLIGVAASSQAQFSVTSRESALNADYLGGYAGQTVGGNPADGSLALLPSSTLSLIGKVNPSGYYPPNDVNWSYTAHWDLTHHYVVTGGLSNATRIEAEGTTALSGLINNASLSVGALNPGNRLALGIHLPTSQTIRLSIDATHIGTGDSNIYVFQETTPGVYTTYWIMNAGTSSLQFRTLPAGNYRIEGSCYSQITGNEAGGSHWRYDFQAVSMEPGSINSVLLGKIVTNSHVADYTDEPVQVEFYTLSNAYVATTTTTANHAGEFGIPVPAAVPAGFYKLRVRGDSTLKKLNPVVLISPNEVQNTGTYSLINGDIDADGEVGAGDFDEVVAHYGDSGVGLPADIDGDGEVGASDFDDVVAHYGLSDE